MTQPESRLSAKIQKAWAEKGVWAFKVHGSEFQPAGIPDIVGVYHGHFVACETKMPGGRLSEIQKFRIGRIRKAGGLVVVAYSVADAMQMLTHVDQHHPSTTDLEGLLEAAQGDAKPEKFRKRPVIIEAYQLTDTNAGPVMAWVKSFYPERVVMRGGPKGGSKGATLVIHTLEGDHVASVGDFVIRGVSDEAYPCKPDIFAATYEPTEEAGLFYPGAIQPKNLANQPLPHVHDCPYRKADNDER